ncbi:MAG: hypothetical protein ABFE13_04735 [Phycisphaerales bacterium]
MMTMRVYENKSLLAILSAFLGILVLAAAGGCRRKSDEDVLARQIAIGQLENAAESENPRLRGLATEALARMNNRRRDTVPILVAAGIESREGRGTVLVLACFDEDQDLSGWCIREEQGPRNGVVASLEERYPVYVGEPATPLFFSLAYDVRIRDAGQRKDEHAWQEFTTQSQQESGDLASDTNEGSRLDPIPYPPVWISIPEPNGVRVFVSVYDRAGHESNSYEIGGAWELSQEFQ